MDQYTVSVFLEREGGSRRWTEGMCGGLIFDARMPKERVHKLTFNVAYVTLDHDRGMVLVQDDLELNWHFEMPIEDFVRDLKRWLCATLQDPPSS